MKALAWTGFYALYAIIYLLIIWLSFSHAQMAVVVAVLFGQIFLTANNWLSKKMVEYDRMREESTLNKN